ncbi:MAG: branched-chain amino acid ABC transporter permease [Geminicoccaceae bacterium]|nr:branched-chain amino acid ABC transporter permease [Geminicoccaceae bacterium]MCB2013211.1 branched-chain amino acid ABC transporter permease [Geminicoccaceae bacterium]
MNAQILALALFDGLSYAALVFMVAVGLTLIFGVLRVLNVAHGSFFAMGAYTTASVGSAIFAAGFAPWLAFPLMAVSAILIGVLVGGTVEKLLLSRIYEMEDVLQILVTFAVFMMLEDVQRLIWGVQPLFESTAVNLLGTIEVFGIVYTKYQLLFLPAVAASVLILLRLGLRHTLTGHLILAVTEDREAAISIGIDAQKVYLVTFIVGASLAAFGGALASATTSVIPGMGADMIVLSFAVVATAGFGQIEGAAIAAVLIGLGRSFAVYFYPELEVLMPYLIMFVVLLIRPNGLFAPVEARKI